MSEALLHSSIRNGRVEGVLAHQVDGGVDVFHLGQRLLSAVIEPHEEGEGKQLVAFDVPAQALNDGVQVLELRDATTGDVLGRVTLMSGEALDEDIRAELALIRSELELLKSTVRRHFR